MGAILSTPGVDSLGTHKFRHRGSHREIVAECVSVEFRRVLKSSNLRTESDVSNWQEALHALVALYNTCLPNITPELLYSTVCTKEARSLMLVMSPEAALEDLCFRHGTTCVMEGNTASTTERSTTDSLFSTGGDQVEEKSYHIGGRDYQKVTGTNYNSFNWKQIGGLSWHGFFENGPRLFFLSSPAKFLNICVVFHWNTMVKFASSF